MCVVAVFGKNEVLVHIWDYTQYGLGGVSRRGKGTWQWEHREGRGGEERGGEDRGDNLVLLSYMTDPLGDSIHAVCVGAVVGRHIEVRSAYIQ